MRTVAESPNFLASSIQETRAETYSLPNPWARALPIIPATRSWLGLGFPQLT